MEVPKIKKYSIIILCALLLSFSLVFLIKKSATSKSVSNKVEKLTKNDITNEDISDELDVYVDVKGSVKAPGVYKLTNKKIVMNAIESAGGLEEYADTTYINLSKKLVDEMVIYIFSKDEVNSMIDSGEITKEKDETIGGVLKNDAYIKSSSKDNVKNNNGGDKSSSDSSKKSDTSTKTSDETEKDVIININTATKEELMNLSGIGEAKAQSIINYRIDNGKFSSIEDIKNVKGIGDSIFEKIKNDICV